MTNNKKFSPAKKRQIVNQKRYINRFCAEAKKLVEQGNEIDISWRDDRNIPELEKKIYFFSINIPITVKEETEEKEVLK